MATQTKRASKTTDEPIALASVRQLFANAHEVSVGDAGKTLRRKLRTTSVWGALCAADPASYGEKGTVKQSANDRKPWGTLPRSFVRDTLGIDC